MLKHVTYRFDMFVKCSVTPSRAPTCFYCNLFSPAQLETSTSWTCNELLRLLNAIITSSTRPLFPVFPIKYCSRSARAEPSTKYVVRLCVSSLVPFLLAATKRGVHVSGETTHFFEVAVCHGCFANSFLFQVSFVSWYDRTTCILPCFGDTTVNYN